jgi:glutamine synthetase
MVSTMIVPAAYKHQATLVTAVGNLKSVGIDAALISGQVADVEKVAGLISELKTALAALHAAAEKAESEDLLKKATALAYEVGPAMEVVRAVCDTLELVVEDALWPLPKYREILFMS